MNQGKLEAGDLAPEFSLPDQNGHLFDSAGLRGKKTILYFFPAAGSPGCTKEAADFQEHIAEFTSRGFSIIGVSPDPVEKLKEFEESHELTFNLLSDENFEVHKKYGAFGEKSIFGKLYRGVLRSTFIIDGQGRIAEAIYNVKATGHTQMLLKKIAN